MGPRLMLLLGWAIILGPGGVVDLALASPEHRAETAAVIVAIATAVLLVAWGRPGWLAPLTAVGGVAMAAADPFEPGPMAWRVATVLADAALAALGLSIWVNQARQRRRIIPPKARGNPRDTATRPQRDQAPRYAGSGDHGDPLADR